MKKEAPQLASKKEDLQGHCVTLFIGSTEYELAGHWNWDLHCEAVFCTDVMIGFPPDFEGTRGIIYPADKELLQQQMAASRKGLLPFLQFRIITTWGEIKTLTGKDLEVSEVTPFFEPSAVVQGVEQRVKTTHPLDFKSELRSFHHSEVIYKTGSWWLDLHSNEMHYSDGVFRIYDLAPQSFNAHVHTFFSFIHHDDRETVIEAFTAAFRRRAPLHLDFRIITARGVEKKVRQVTHWEYDTVKGTMLYGLLQDITEVQALEMREKLAQYDLQFAHRLLNVTEQSYLMGYWYVNLATRKVVYSDSIYRLYGLKPQSIPGGINIFLNYVHLDDRDVVKEVTRKILAEHVPPDIEFRVVRSDGKVRYVRQKGRMGIYGEGEMVMMVTMQDITAEKTSERKLAELQQLVSIAEFARKSSEEMAAMGSWFMDMETEALTWSEGLYALLGLKTKAVAFTQKALLHYVHPDYQKRFRDEWKLVIKEGQESNFDFRMIRNGQVQHISASFKIFHYGGKALFIGTLQDLTQHQELKKELMERIHVHEAITSNMPELALVTDEENTIIFWNRQAELVNNITKEEALNRNFFDIFPSLKTAETLQHFQKAWNGEKVWVPQTKTTAGNESYDLLMLPVRSESGLITGIMHLARDVTKEFGMESTLKERAQFVECLVEASVNRLIIMDRHMNYLYCNEKAAEFYGLSKEEIIGKNVLEVFPGSFNDPTFDHFRRALKGETVRIPAIEGLLDEHKYEVHLLPIKDDHGVVTAVVWTHYRRDAEEHPGLED